MIRILSRNSQTTHNYYRSYPNNWTEKDNLLLLKQNGSQNLQTLRPNGLNSLPIDPHYNLTRQCLPLLGKWKS